MPLAVGGGIKTIDDAKLLFNSGADKVIINTAAYSNKPLLSFIVSRWGSQALIVSIDASKTTEKKYVTKSECGTRLEPVNLVDHINSVIDLGAGEIMINSIDNDGVMNGYDLVLIDLVMSVCTIPLIICGGAGNYDDLKEAFNKGVSAVACGSLFNFGDNNPLRAKAYLKNYNIPLKRV